MCVCRRGKEKKEKIRAKESLAWQEFHILLLEEFVLQESSQ